jgi:Transglutaminase-like superfamily
VIPTRGRRLPVRERLRLAVEVLRTYQQARRLMHRQKLDQALASLRAGAVPPTGLSGAQEQFAAFRLGRAVVLILALLPTDRRCLVRSLTLSALLARRGIPARLVLGVRPDTAQPFGAHAWVEHDGVAVTSDEGYNRLHEL